jgi:hypothetical protein
MRCLDMSRAVRATILFLPLLNHCIRPDGHGLWDRQAEPLRGLEVDQGDVLPLDLAGVAESLLESLHVALLHGKVGRLGALEDPVDVARCTPEVIGVARTVGDGPRADGD